MDLIPEPYDLIAFAIAMVLILGGCAVECRRFLMGDDTPEKLLKAVRLNNLSALLFLGGAGAAFVSDHPGLALIFFMFACGSTGTTVQLRHQAAQLRAAERQAAIEIATEHGMSWPGVIDRARHHRG